MRKFPLTAMILGMLFAVLRPAGAAEPSAAGLWQKVEDGKTVGWIPEQEALPWKQQLTLAFTNPAGRAGCVLIRALEPVTGVRAMARRRGVPPDARRLASGPGNLTRALGVTLRDNGADLTRSPLVILPPDRPRDFRIARGRRVGITRATDRALRFWIAGDVCVSGPSSRSAGRRTRGRRGGGGAPRPGPPRSAGSPGARNASRARST